MFSEREVPTSVETTVRVSLDPGLNGASLLQRYAAGSSVGNGLKSDPNLACRIAYLGDS